MMEMETITSAIQPPGVEIYRNYSLKYQTVRMLEPIFYLIWVKNGKKKPLTIFNNFTSVSQSVLESQNN